MSEPQKHTSTKIPTGLDQKTREKKNKLVLECNQILAMVSLVFDIEQEYD